MRSQKEIGLKILSPIELRALQEALLEIYQEIFRICQKYSLSLLLGGCSALGAVRHGGFIPWDDDMDLMMFREDYDVFMDKFEKEHQENFRLKKNGLSLHILKSNTQYVGLFDMDLMDSNIYIDIFPIDNVPQNKSCRLFKGVMSDMLLFLHNSKNIYLCKNTCLKKMYSVSMLSMVLYYLRKGLGFFVSLLKDDTILMLHKRFVVTKKTSHMVSIPSGRKHYFGELLPYSVFFPAQEATFEGHKCYLPNQVDVYLSNLYGADYMQLPPEDKREVHPCLAFSLNTEG